MKNIFIVFFTGLSGLVFSQQTLQTLSVEKIMRDPKWIGTSPSNPYWSQDGSTLYFSWNPEQAASDSLYYITAGDIIPKKTTVAMREQIITESNITYNNTRSAFAFLKDGDVFVTDLKSRNTRRITETVESEVNPQFVENDRRLVYSRNQNLFSFDLSSGLTRQLTNFQRGNAGGASIGSSGSGNRQESWLQQDQLNTFDVLKSRKEKREATAAALKAIAAKKALRTIHLGDRFLSGVTISPDARFITYRLSTAPPPSRSTIIPNYVTESGFTTDISGRTKVGAAEGSSIFYIFDSREDTILTIRPEDIPGIRDLPDYANDYPKKDSSPARPRTFNITGPYWNDKGSQAVVELRSTDNKDRWIMALDAVTGRLKFLDRQRDEAWIGGPGISAFGVSGSRWIDDDHYWYQSEVTGYSHLYKVNTRSGEKTAITKGGFEVQSAQLSKDRKFFYLTSNQLHPGEQHFYKVPVSGGQLEQITKLTGAHQVVLSPDERQLGILYSYTNKPWELYIQPNKAGASWKQVTARAQSEEFASYKWKEPEVISFTARDGAKIFARLYKPSTSANGKPAVIFVHGAGYLQNAHKWWSQYFREYMFNNLLADKGYTVMDIDYRGSAGYGRDWRTGIYRHMGGKDLTDHVDAAKYLVEQLGVDRNKIGIYGGSYGGFITLMAMFTEPEVFAAGAALRSVTDWAHYNHGYTSNILNEPYTDSIAYRKSSPIYYANGLKGHLLMCHGMVDVNVHFQDIVRLSQRLIELGKDNWELAVYPVEDHAFVEPSSWIDEYKRVLKLFESKLK